MASKIFLIAAIAAALNSCVSGLLLSTSPLTHNEAVMFCAKSNTRLADVTSQNRDLVIAQVGEQSVWIGSWDYNFYSGECLEFHNGHVGGVDCDHKRIAACNPPVVYKSTAEVDEQQVSSPHHSHVSGPRSLARSSRRSHAKCEESSSSSSSSSCRPVRDCAPRCGFEYAYLTRYVDLVYTSVAVATSFSSTAISPVYFATVQAYTITGIP